MIASSKVALRELAAVHRELKGTELYWHPASSSLPDGAYTQRIKYANLVDSSLNGTVGINASVLPCVEIPLDIMLIKM